MTNETPIIRINGLEMRREETVILRNINWTIRPGEHWALLGANGSGKTSLLKLLTGYEWPTTGRIEVLGNLYGETNLPQLRKQIGLVGSSIAMRMHDGETALQVAVSGFESSIGRYREFTTDEYQRAAEALAMVSAQAIAHRPWRLLSQGERQRALIARAIVPNPALLILDEPCAGLDPAAREWFLDDMEKLAISPTAPTIVFVTHHIEELRPFITHAMILKAGSILATGVADDVITENNMHAAFGRACVLRRNGRVRTLELPRS